MWVAVWQMVRGGDLSGEQETHKHTFKSLRTIHSFDDLLLNKNIIHPESRLFIYSWILSLKRDILAKLLILRRGQRNKKLTVWYYEIILISLSIRDNGMLRFTNKSLNIKHVEWIQWNQLSDVWANNWRYFGRAVGVQQAQSAATASQSY